MNLKDNVEECLENVVDTCTHLNIVDMGIVEAVTVDEAKKQIDITMLPTTPFCMFLNSIESEIELLIKNYHEFDGFTINFHKSDRVWTQERLSVAAVNRLLS
ncbi:metal-sulfur cluster assembly factor [Lactococcus insecticola]|uniref:MIP18 family-like domain-containing protein n=1 Tax=Pseudolactococcus insecticola TaxID=2709158 RepID=A0A6A0B678_9LACT|nr:iron-sulfur cluster assembly protein [Lactococcus insecticola]GFH40910.1 hypothetical protein Hs20B_13080 [Lactococcus insecticola]